VGNLDATLFDAEGRPLAHDTTSQSQAVLRPCVDSSDTYLLAVKASTGTGSWVAEAWAGATAVGVAPGAAVSQHEDGAGTCASPTPLAAGVTSGSTTRGKADNAGSCGPSDSREIVYALTTTRRTHATFEVEAEFDSILYIRKDDCADSNAEVECNDDSSDRRHSLVDVVLEPARYFIFVDGYGHEGGDYKLTVTLSEVQAVTDRCRRASPLVDGAQESGTTLGMTDDAHATCGGGGAGPDAVWRAEIPTRARVRIVEHSDDMVPVVHVRRACGDAQSEVACGESGATAGDATVTGIFDAGTYAVFADSHERSAAGRYSLLLQTAPTAGSGSTSDACGDASVLPTGVSGSIEGDTFSARDDLSGSCGGAGAPDVVYRLNVARRSLLLAALGAEESEHVLIVGRGCGDRAQEVACGRSVREVVAPGTYFLAVDGSSPESFGRFTLDWVLRDVAEQRRACSAAPTLVEGRMLNGTTAGSGDRFATLCGASDSGASGRDRVFKLVLARAASVRLSVVATFDAVIALRKACEDPTGGPLPELACESDADANHRTTLTRALEPGTYWVVVDGQAPSDQGPFTLEYHVRH
jgi:hypothetical protein